MTRRWAHRIRPNTTERRPVLVAWIGVDADSAQNDRGAVVETFRSATALVWRHRTDCAHDVEQTFTAADSSAFLDALLLHCRSKVRLVVVSVNPARDLKLLDAIAYFRDRGWTVGHPVMSVRLTLVPLSRDNRRVLFVAHGNLFPYLDPPRGPANSATREMRDVWLEHLKLLDDLDAGDFKLTLGSQSLSIYRHRFMDHSIYVHGDETVDRLERRACFGAVYQPFYVGRAPAGRYYYLDTVAMYPWCMRYFECPWRLVSYGGALPAATLARMAEKRLVIATVTVETDHQHYPVKLDGHSRFPVGRFTTTLTTPDLLHALERNRIVAVHEYATYDGAHLFDRYVDELWSMRLAAIKRGDPLRAALCKNWMVSLYGAWGAWRIDRRLEVEDEDLEDGSMDGYDMSAGEQRHYVALGGRMYSERRSGSSFHGFPAIMAHVAAYGRQRMWQLMSQAGREHVLFCLSDGLIVDRVGYQRLCVEINAARLGALKEKRDGSTFIALSDTECYLDDRSWKGGIPVNAVQIEDGVYVLDLERHTVASLAAGEPGRYVHLAREITLTRSVQSGVVTESGWTTPLEAWQ